MDEDLFDAFDDAPAAPPAKRIRADNSARSSPAPPPVQAPNALPPAFVHLDSEAIASIHFRGMADECRAQIEDAMCNASVANAATRSRPRLTPDTERAANGTIAAAGVVHFFQSFTADFAGASSIKSAVSGPKTLYERLPMEPLPWGRGEAGAAASAGGRGNGGGRRGPPPRGTPRRGPALSSGRYFDSAPTAFTPGVLSPALRQLLGMREGDPPPYLGRMQQLGYPPGYVGDPEAAPPEDTPLELYESDAAAADALRAADGRGEAAQRRPRVPLHDFPGLNVPPPPGTDPRAWGWFRR